MSNVRTMCAKRIKHKLLRVNLISWQSFAVYEMFIIDSFKTSLWSELHYEYPSMDDFCFVEISERRQV